MEPVIGFVPEEGSPPPGDLRDELLLELFGSPDCLQVDGIGGSKSHTSKVRIVSPSNCSDIDLQYRFGQVTVKKPVVDWGGNCGNLTSAVGAYGYIWTSEPTTDLRYMNLSLI